MHMHPYSKTNKLLLCALFAALTAVCSFISIPLPLTPVPVSPAMLPVFLSGSLLGWKYGTVSQCVYIFLGAVGLPVFHNFTGGLGILAGPTGGYILGYAAAALITGLLLKGRTSFPALAGSMTAGLCVCYLLGTLWFMVSSGSSLLPALVSCVLPFLPGDALKICAACILTRKLKFVIER